MTDMENLSKTLAPLGLGAWQFHPVVGSTNDMALDWARQGAPDWSLVLADAQSAGRGRGGRRWVTKPGSALALSLVLRPSPAEAACLSRFTALAAIGLIRSLAALGLHGEIKWPNDILVEKKKVGGVLVELDWEGEAIKALVVGLGVNVKPDAVPDPDELRYPATSVAGAAGRSVDRWALLADTLRAMMDIRSTLIEETFIKLWNAHLAFQDQWVLFRFASEAPQRVKIEGVTPDGWLALVREDGQKVSVMSGEIVMVYN